MAIIWLIIKIILCVLLGILAICLGIIGIVLITPIYYEAYLEKYDALNYHFKISTMRWVYARITVEDGEEKSELKVFGKVFRKREAVKMKVKEAKENVQEEVKQKIDEEIEGKIEIQNKVEPEDDLKFIGASQEEKQVITRKLAKFILNPLFWPAFKAFLVFGKRLIVYLRPREWSFECIMGKEDHADTGELIAKLTMLYPFYYQHGTIKGNYEKAGVWGGFLAQGKFCLGGILKHILVFLLNKATRQYIQWFLKYRKEEENGE